MNKEADRLRAILIEELPRLRRFAYSLTGIKEDADDLTQAVIERILTKGLPPDVHPRRWLLRVCKNLWIDEIRSRSVRRRVANEELVHESEAEHGEQHLLNAFEAEKAVAALDKLPEAQRLAICLVAVEGLTYAEAAEVLEVPIGTVMSRISRARRNIVALLETA